MEKRYPPRERRTSRRILAENLRLIRLQRQIPQDELADLVGLDRSYLGGVERGERNIAVDNLDKIAEALGVSVPQLLTEPDTSGIPGHVVEEVRCRIKEDAGVYRVS
jgi:transcriptional regulator with XRE-family HTH domain